MLIFNACEDLTKHGLGLLAEVKMEMDVFELSFPAEQHERFADRSPHDDHHGLMSGEVMLAAALATEESPANVVGDAKLVLVPSQGLQPWPFPSPLL